MSNSVKRRYVLYVAGFDPTGPAHYHRLYQDQSALQAQLGDYQLEVGARQKLAAHLSAWKLRCMAPSTALNTTTETDYVFARWDDIVRTHWQPTNGLAHMLRFLVALCATQWFYLRQGAWWRMLKLAWPPALALVAPMLLFFSCALVWLLVPWLAYVLQPAAWPIVTWAELVWIATLWAAATGLLVWLLRSLEVKFHMLWLMRSYMFTHQYALDKVPLLAARIDLFAAAIAQARSSGAYDEVVVVGHSSGCVVAASAVAQSLHMMPMASDTPATQLGLVTLGQCIALLSSLPMAQPFCNQLRSITASGEVCWVDFTAPTDGCCFAFVDPSYAHNQAQTPTNPFPHTVAQAPILLSPRFQTLMSPARYATLRKHRFDLHFQYIKAGSILGDYDYFAITAGSWLLRARFASARSVTDFKKFQLFG